MPSGESTSSPDLRIRLAFFVVYHKKIPLLNYIKHGNHRHLLFVTIVFILYRFWPIRGYLFGVQKKYYYTVFVSVNPQQQNRDMEVDNIKLNVYFIVVGTSSFATLQNSHKLSSFTGAQVINLAGLRTVIEIL